MTDSDDNLRDWIGKTTTSTATITPFPMAALAAMLNKPESTLESGTPVPALGHWLYFLDTPAQSQLAADGHATRGGFLPPVTLPRRMWAGSRIAFKEPLRMGDKVQRRSSINNVVSKTGRSGKLVFVTVEHVLSHAAAPDVIILQEQHDIVYREPANADATPAQPLPATANASHSRTIYPDAVLLFRYSALTFNSHRIHYDREFAVNEEGYPGLVVHGPLLATLMVNLLQSTYPEHTLCDFEFKAVHPVVDLHPFDVCCGTPNSDGEVSLWIRDHANTLCMTGKARLKRA